MSRFLKYLDGDLNQIIIQKKHIQLHYIGVTLSQDSGFAPHFESEADYEIALSSIWVEHVEGWWNYRADLIKLNICTEEEFDSRLSAVVVADKAKRAERESRGWLH